MATESDLHTCLKALDDVTWAFLEARRSPLELGQYEADTAAFQLMEVVFRHVNAVTGVAAMPPAGFHAVTAWVMLRSAFEVAVTAYWLTRDNDWVEREARWLGWMAGEEEHQQKLAADLRPINPDASDRLVKYRDSLQQRREAIARLLPKDSRIRRPNLLAMLQECEIQKRYYIAYRLGSQFMHGGPAVCHEVFEPTDANLRMKPVDYGAWVGLLRMASWCIAQPGQIVLQRAGVPLEAVRPIVEKHQVLLAQVESLED